MFSHLYYLFCFVFFTPKLNDFFLLLFLNCDTHKTKQKTHNAEAITKPFLSWLFCHGKFAMNRWTKFNNFWFEFFFISFPKIRKKPRRIFSHFNFIFDFFSQKLNKFFVFFSLIFELWHPFHQNKSNPQMQKQAKPSNDWTLSCLRHLQQQMPHSRRLNRP